MREHKPGIWLMDGRDKEWTVKALAMHAALIASALRETPIGGADFGDLKAEAEAYEAAIGDFARGALNKPVDPFS